MTPRTIEPQYIECFEHVAKHGRADLGIMHSHSWHKDPKHLLFALSRYKFVAKMLAGRANVLEIGCADAFAARLVRQSVRRLTVTDFDPVWVTEAAKGGREPWDYTAKLHNMLQSPLPENFDGVYALDVLEHIRPEDEHCFLTNICQSMARHGVLVIGTPSAESQAFASSTSKAGHVNCKDGESLRQSVLRFFSTVLMFSMNDEVVHTGFFPMAHYLFAVCVDRR